MSSLHVVPINVCFRLSKLRSFPHVSFPRTPRRAGMLTRFGLDSAGVCASTLCMIHCLASPLVLAVLPSWKPEPPAQPQVCCETECQSEPATPLAECCGSPGSFWLHAGLLALVAPLGIVAWVRGYRQHGHIETLWLGVVGLLLASGALVFGQSLFLGRGEQVLTVAGSLCMASAHLWNQHRRPCCGRRADCLA